MKTKIQIRTVWGSVLWESEKETIKEAVLEKYNKDANLRNANLWGANLRNADLRGADLRGADLWGANLRGANLRNANLRDADLWGANLRDADLRGADLWGANLWGANLRNANLRNADLWQLPKDFINQCSRDILFIFDRLKSELPKFKELLIQGKIDGSQYNGDCVCLVGSFAEIKNKEVDNLCKEFIPFYEKGTHNMGETWFLNIREGDTPENNQFSAHVLKLIEMVETGKYYTIEYNPTDEQLKEWEEKRKELAK